MKTHTIRWNGNRTHRIITFTPSFMKVLLQSEDLAVCIVMATMRKHLKRLTGRDHTFDYEQSEILLKHVKSIRIPYEKKGYRYDRIMSYIIDGVENGTIIAFDELLDLLNYVCRNLKMEGTPYEKPK